MDMETYSPAMNAAFDGASCGPACTDITDPTCSCDASSYYWSATSVADDPTNAWLVDTGYGNANFDDKTNAVYARAVRGGS
jgi:hypothetical protein